MLEKLQFYIDGQWVDPVEPRTLDVVNPATEEVYGRISLGSAADVDNAVAYSFALFPDHAIDAIEKIHGAYPEVEKEKRRSAGRK